MGGSDTHYSSGEDIRPGDRVRSGDWAGVVVLVLGIRSAASGYAPAEWAHMGRGFLVEYDRAGLVFADSADADLELVARAEPGAAADGPRL